MFGLSFGEIMIVLLVIVVFIRPRDLPQFVRRIGQLYGQVRKLGMLARDQIRAAEREAEEESRTTRTAHPDDLRPPTANSQGPDDGPARPEDV